jgi:DNA-binding transcriptional ArsR family regulator
MGAVTVLSNHGLALVCIAREPRLRLREIADCIGVTERTAHQIVSDLVEAGYVERFREGNRNRYEVRLDVPMPDALLEDHWIGELLVVLATQALQRRDGRGPGTPERRDGRDRRAPKASVVEDGQVPA